MSDSDEALTAARSAAEWLQSTPSHERHEGRGKGTHSIAALRNVHLRTKSVAANVAARTTVAERTYAARTRVREGRRTSVDVVQSRSSRHHPRRAGVDAWQVHVSLGTHTRQECERARGQPL